MLDDATHAPARVAHHAPVARRVAEVGGADGESALRLGHQLLERFGAHQGHVAVQHQHLRAARHFRQRLRERVARTELLRLLDPLHARAGEGRSHFGAAVAMHHEDLFRLERAGRVEHVRKERPASEGMQHFRQRGVHALSLPGGEHDHGKAHGAGF